MSLSTTQITETFIDPTSGQPFSNINVSFQVSQVLYIAGIPAVTPASPIAAEVAGGQLQAAAGGTLELADQGNAVTLQSGTGFWFWTVAITGDITDSWDFMLAHSSSPVELYSTKNTPAAGGFTGGTLAKYLAPAVAALTDGASVAIDASQGNVFDWPLGGSGHTLAVPSNPVNGETILIRIAYSGSFTPLFNAIFDFGAAGQPSWTAASGKRDHVAFAWDGAAWCFHGAQLGFSS